MLASTWTYDSGGHYGTVVAAAVRRSQKRQHVASVVKDVGVDNGVSSARIVAILTTFSHSSYHDARLLMVLLGITCVEVEEGSARSRITLYTPMAHLNFGSRVGILLGLSVVTAEAKSLMVLLVMMLHHNRRRRQKTLMSTKGGM